MGRHYTAARAMALGAGLAALLAAGCGSSSDSSSTAASKGTGGEDAGVTYAKAEVAKYEKLVTDFTAPGPALDGDKIKGALSGKTVWYVPVFLQAPVFSADAKALVEPLKLAGAKLQVCDAKANPTSAASCIKQATAANAAAIITEAIDWSFASQAQAAAVKKGIPIIASNNDNVSDFPDDPLVRPVSANVPKTWRLMTDYIIAKSGGKANLVWAADNSNGGKIAAAAMADELKTRCPGCAATKVEYSDLTIQRLATAISTAMVKNPKVDYVAGAYDAPAGIFALQGAKQVQGRKFTYLTATGQPPGLQRVAAGQQEATAGGDTAVSMWNTADALFRVVTKAAPVKQYTNALRIFTKDNLPADVKDTSGYAAGEWYTDGSFRAIYSKAWGLGSGA
jgi:ribose transport system substrate-binding protein